MVTIDASPGVRALADSLEVVVRGGPATTEDDPSEWTQSFRHTWPRNAIDWPVSIALVPRDNDASRGYFVIATAHDGTGGSIARVRTRSGYVAGRTLWLRIVLDDADVCHPSTVNVYCRDEVTTVEELKPWPEGHLDADWSDASTPDAHADSAASDGMIATDAGDAAVDAAIDAGIETDAQVDAPLDTGPTLDCTTLDCDDGNPCTTEDQCNSGICLGIPVTCGANQTCNPDTGSCVCNPGTLRCGNACVAGVVCCPGSTHGSCGQCGTSVCNGNGTGFSCTGEHGNCNGGICHGSGCGPETGGTCPDNTRRECFDCHWSGCF